MYILTLIFSTRVVQKLIEAIKSRQQISLIMVALKPGLLDLIKDQNGNHVVQRCLQSLTIDQNKVKSLSPSQSLQRFWG